jgi:hypothetical protein
VSATAFIGNRPDRATTSATAVFCPGGGERLLEDLDFQGLAAEQPFELPNPLFELADLGGADHLVVDADRFTAALGHPLPPSEQQARRDAVPAGHERDRHAGLEGLLDQPDLLRHRPAPAALHRADHLDAPNVLRHRPTPRLMPRPSRYAACPVETGAAPLAAPEHAP